MSDGAWLITFIDTSKEYAFVSARIISDRNSKQINMQNDANYKSRATDKSWVRWGGMR